MSEKTPEERKQELDAELSSLEESFTRRLEEARAEVDSAREAGRADAAELFPEGALGRVDAQPGDELLQLVEDRERLLDEVKSDPEQQLEARKAETERLIQEFDQLRATASDPNSPGQRAARERGAQAIDRQLRSNLRNIAGISNDRGIGMQGGLVNDALQGAVDARANLERDLTIERERALTDITKEGAAARSESLRRQEDVINKQREQVAGLQSRLEDLQGAIRQDTLQRQQFNLEQNAAEIFGRLGTEEGRVNQSLALITGTRAETLSELQAAKSNVRAEESLEIQRIEAEKDPPSGGGGKSIFCIQYWLTGDISNEILEGDFQYSFMEPGINDDVRICYYSWSSWIAPQILKKGLLYRIFKPFTLAWANEMASRVGVPSAKSNWLGSIMCTLGVPIHRAVGRVMSWCGYRMDEVEKKHEVQELFGEAAHLWKNAQQKALMSMGCEVIR